jgi:hypothetical protein
VTRGIEHPDFSLQSKRPRFAQKPGQDAFYNDSEGEVGIMLNCLNITCAIAEIPDPPPYSLSDNPRLLVDYWEGTISLGFQIQGISVLLKYWREVYAYNRPEVWKRQKENWNRVRVSVLDYKISFITRYIIEKERH